LANVKVGIVTGYLFFFAKKVRSRRSGVDVDRFGEIHVFTLSRCYA
jgi:hypothetical protein